MAGHTITDIRYADDPVLLAESEENLQRPLDKTRAKGLMLIALKKTDCMVVSKTESPSFSLHKFKEVTRNVSSFTEDARC